MTIEQRLPGMHPTTQWALHRLVTLVIPVVGLASLAAMAGCSRTPKGPEIPSVFEVTGQTTINGQTLTTVRDIGTGCEFVMSDSGLLPRNERSIDGAAVKQRCVLTGAEQSAATGVTTTTIPADPTQTSAIDTQAADVAAAVREATAPAPTAREIPPPTGKGSRPKAVPLPTRPAPRPSPTPATDGVESQLRN